MAPRGAFAAIRQLPVKCEAGRDSEAGRALECVLCVPLGGHARGARHRACAACRVCAALCESRLLRPRLKTYVQTIVVKTVSIRDVSMLH
jgi:hypothetical protein